MALLNWRHSRRLRIFLNPNGLDLYQHDLAIVDAIDSGAGIFLDFPRVFSYHYFDAIVDDIADRDTGLLNQLKLLFV